MTAGCRAAPMPDPGACLWRRYYCQHHRGPFYQGSDLSPLYLAHYPDTADRVVGITGGKYCMAPYPVVVRFRNKSLCPRNRPVVPRIIPFCAFFPLPAERDGFSHHQHCGAQFYGGLGGSSALGLLPCWRQNCFSLPGADSRNRRHHAGLALVKTPSATSPSASLKV